MVCRGMSLIAAAIIARRNARMYQLATSAVNPVTMGRSIELTGLAHRKHYRMRAKRRQLAQSKIRNHPRFQTALRAHVHPHAKSGGLQHQPRR